jgi:glutamine amidotransferase
MRNLDVVVIDYGVGNLLSVQRALEYCGARVALTADREKILAADRLVLPGVGAYANAMKELKNLGLVAVMKEVKRHKTPLLGICLGMQLLLDESEEFGVTSGLGLIPGRVVAIPSQDFLGAPQKIPHIGWSSLSMPDVEMKTWDETILRDTRKNDAFYFVHSFMAVPENSSHRIADCLYGGHKITAVIECDNIIGCQFHPEKSGELGLDLLRKFILR